MLIWSKKNNKYLKFPSLSFEIDQETKINSFEGTYLYGSVTVYFNDAFYVFGGVDNVGPLDNIERLRIESCLVDQVFHD